MPFPSPEFLAPNHRQPHPVAYLMLFTEGKPNMQLTGEKIMKEYPEKGGKKVGKKDPRQKKETPPSLLLYGLLASPDIAVNN